MILEYLTFRPDTWTDIGRLINNYTLEREMSRLHRTACYAVNVANWRGFPVAGVLAPDANANCATRHWHFNLGANPSPFPELPAE